MARDVTTDDGMGINYDHSQNRHTLAGPQAAMPILFAGYRPSSLLDVGCGTGTWLKAAIDFGIGDVFGVDGVKTPADKLHVASDKIQQLDLTGAWNLEKQYDVVFCLEVAEHLDMAFAPKLIDALVNHGDHVFFSAACPGQPGQHHVNCQWPDYWQRLFNQRGFVCDDAVRWQIWDIPEIEPWYRQNMFVARRDAASSGQEPRIKAILHPEMVLACFTEKEQFDRHITQIENGRMDVIWYLKTPALALSKKVKRHCP